MTVKMRRYVFACLCMVLVVFIYVKSSFVGKLLYPIYYEQEIRQSALNYDMNPYLLAAIIRVESNYEKKSISHKGAIGVMQLMPTTAAWIIERGFNNQIASKDIAVVETNINLGTWYLSWLYQYYEGNLVQAVAAYNAGQGNVDRWLQNKTWDGTIEQIEQVPYQETKQYVQRVLYYYEKYQKLHRSA